MVKFYDCILLAASAFAFSCQRHQAMSSSPVANQREGVHTVVSDDSVVVAQWWDAGDGGTAPDIEAQCLYRTANGETMTEKRPLLQIVHPSDDCGHHQIERIVTLEGEYGTKTYIFFLSAKVGTQEFQHDMVAFQIEGKNLCPVSAFSAVLKPTSHVSIRDGEIR